MLWEERKESLQDWELRFIVGRENELALFEDMLEQAGAEAAPLLLNVYGTGGVGKSTFLRLCRRKASREDMVYIRLDSRDYMHSEAGIAGALLAQLKAAPGPGEEPLEAFLSALARIAGGRTVVLEIDNFEEMHDMENWLRERLIPLLPSRLLLLFSGRQPLRGGWMLSPVWRTRLRQLQLGHLAWEEFSGYLELCGIADEAVKDRIWRRTGGHPLAMSLAAAAQTTAAGNEPAEGPDWFDELAGLWLQEVADRELRRHVEAAAALVIFDQELLSFIMEEEVPADVFDRLVSLSFVRRSERGWQLHDLMREATVERLKKASPKRHRRLMERCAAYYAGVVIDGARTGENHWEVEELFRYIGIDVIRALLTERTCDNYYWETVTASTLQEAVQYMKWREQHISGVSGIETDPVTGNAFPIEYTAEMVRYNLAPLDLEALFRLDSSSISLLRSEEGDPHAMLICIPIHAGTLSWLTEDPHSGPYFRSITQEERDQLRVPANQPAGWYFRTFDCPNVLDPDLRSAGVRKIYSFLCRRGLLVCSPFNTEITRTTYPGFGFSVDERATHYNYDGKTPTLTYVLDTRGEKLRGFVRRLFERAGIPWELERPGQEPALPAAEPHEHQTSRTEAFPRFDEHQLGLLSDRERDVALLVLEGCSNIETAARLYISEATVKKHLKSVFAKLGINKRTQLAGKLLKP